MLLEVGFDRMSMRKIATSVGCSATSIYLYFTNKDDLLHALIEEGFDLLYDELVKVTSEYFTLVDPELPEKEVTRTNGEPSALSASPSVSAVKYAVPTLVPKNDSQALLAEALDGSCRSFIRFGMENPEYYEIMFQLHPKHMQRYPVEKYRKARRNIDLIGRILRCGHERNLFHIPNGDTKLVANVILSTLHGGVSLMNAGRIDAKVDRNQYTEIIIQSILAGVKARELGGGGN